jgi:hypothetical protein
LFNGTKLPIHGASACPKSLTEFAAVLSCFARAFCV